MWAAQHYKFNKPNRWMTSGGLGTMGYGLPAAVGVQIAHPEKLVIDIAGEASVLMTMQEMSTAVQYNLPIKIFILNNQYMGMVRQWQELLHEKNYSESYSEALPDFMKMAEAYGCKGIKADNPDDLDDKIQEMIDYDGPVIFDCHVDPNENCFPMIPSGKPHNQMILGPNDQEENKIKGKGKAVSITIMPKSKSAYSIPTKKQKPDTYIFVVWVDNEAGVLARVVGLFSGRGYNIESLAVAEVDAVKNISRITIVTTGTPQVIDQIRLQLTKLVPVHKVAEFKREDKGVIFKEMALFKVVGKRNKIEKCLNACKKFNPVILDKTKTSAVIQITALRREIDKMNKKLKPLGLISTSRTGAVAMTRGAKIFN